LFTWRYYKFIEHEVEFMHGVNTKLQKVSSHNKKTQNTPREGRWFVFNVIKKKPIHYIIFDNSYSSRCFFHILKGHLKPCGLVNGPTLRNRFHSRHDLFKPGKYDPDSSPSFQT